MSNIYETHRFVIINTSDLGSISWNQIFTTSSETARKSIDGTKSLLHFDLPWCGCLVPTIANLANKSQIYTHNEILEVMKTSEWSIPQTNE